MKHKSCKWCGCSYLQHKTKQKCIDYLLEKIEDMKEMAYWESVL